jgi:hypothetical protein
MAVCDIIIVMVIGLLSLCIITRSCRIAPCLLCKAACSHICIKANVYRGW